MSHPTESPNPAHPTGCSGQNLTPGVTPCSAETPVQSALAAPHFRPVPVVLWPDCGWCGTGRVTDPWCPSCARAVQSAPKPVATSGPDEDEDLTDEDVAWMGVDCAECGDEGEVWRYGLGRRPCPACARRDREARAEARIADLEISGGAR